MSDGREVVSASRYDEQMVLYISVLVSEQTCSEEDYGGINYCLRKSFFVKHLSTDFPPNVLPSLMRQMVAKGERGAAWTRGMSIDPVYCVSRNSL